ncbi:diguanylate cyclase (GGDEF) domain-containing protein [Blastococcus aggregatus]|uniref:Diguanylate cyclase (GGDEF) domain-containing protein n=1 Tax=Blastococcus aggregatus TaxID=38502 RepID=A0A285V2H6_9ACTN|nr:diguanylate cyclase (GGDEF) domain-containing protein [Blastococcus aggregatus]
MTDPFRIADGGAADADGVPRLTGGTVRPRPSRALPADVRRRGGGGGATLLVEAVLDALPSPTLLVDRNGTVLLANSAWNEAAETLDDDRFRVPVGGDYFALALQVRDDEHARALVAGIRELSMGLRDSATADLPVQLASGTRWFHLQASRVDEAGNIVLTHTDVTSRVRAERASAWQARHDALTGLPNRSYLHQLIDADLAAPRTRVAVLFLDVDGFKEVNDSLGHDTGDDLLREVAARLTAAVREDDTVGRLGGDEFVVLSRGCTPVEAEALAERLRVTLERPFELGGHVVRIGASIGIAGTSGHRYLRSTDLVRDADLAMYAAKAAGRNRVHVFSPDLRAAAERRATLANELRDALVRDELVLHYQPVLHLPSGRCTGMEALVRWQHPERGLLAPGEFLPTAQAHDLMTPLARWVMTAATRQIAEWSRIGLDLVVAVNITAEQFSSGTLVEDVFAALSDAGVPPELLVVELTETSVAEDPERAAQQMAELRRRGVEVSIDDFGSGFSSLGQLVTLPAGMLKIDRSLVNYTEGHRDRAAAAIAAVVALGKACGIRSLAEGVETAGQLALAAELDCTFAQGFHIARPMPAEAVPGWVSAQHATAAPVALAAR